jgi:hypothetical protein
MYLTSGEDLTNGDNESPEFKIFSLHRDQLHTSSSEYSISYHGSQPFDNPTVGVLFDHKPFSQDFRLDKKSYVGNKKTEEDRCLQERV